MLRWIAKLIGTFILLVALLVVVVLWRLRPVPHERASGEDLVSVLTGRWDWTTRDHPCTDGGHVIAFSEDRKVMTITQVEPDSATGVRTMTTYDIIEEAPSIITGAIRGETRMTTAGVPAVWELILIGPGSYTWRRTDWSRWSSTVTIVRCDDPEAPKTSMSAPTGVASSR